MKAPRSSPAFTLARLALCLLLSACATYTVIDDARQMFGEGRGEEALALLDKAAAEGNSDPAVRAEYDRQRSLLAVQWLGQAESLRLAGQFRLAEVLFQ